MLVYLLANLFYNCTSGKATKVQCVVGTGTNIVKTHPCCLGCAMYVQFIMEGHMVISQQKGILLFPFNLTCT